MKARKHGRRCSLIKSAHDLEITRHSRDDRKTEGTMFSVRSNIYRALDPIMAHKRIPRIWHRVQVNRMPKHSCGRHRTVMYTKRTRILVIDVIQEACNAFTTIFALPSSHPKYIQEYTFQFVTDNFTSSENSTQNRPI